MCSVQSGRSARGALEPHGEFDDQAFGSTDVAEEEGVLEADDIPVSREALVLEAAQDVGGRMRTEAWEGARIERCFSIRGR